MKSLKALLLALAVLPAPIAARIGKDYVSPSLDLTNVRPRDLTWTENALRMNHMQVVGTHNSYHREAHTPDLLKAQQNLIGEEKAKELMYSQADLQIQLSEQKMRALELDVWVDPHQGLLDATYDEPFYIPEGLSSFKHNAWKIWGFKVFNIADVDQGTSCVSLRDCLGQIRHWMDNHREALPLTISLQFKQTEHTFGAPVVPWTRSQFNRLDDAIAEELGRGRIIAPKDILLPDMTLEQSILSRGWPDLSSARGKAVILMQNTESHKADDPRGNYLEGQPYSEEGIMFVSSFQGDPACAIIYIENINDWETHDVRAMVEAGYIVKTNADTPKWLMENSCGQGQRDKAFKSGAHIISTVSPLHGMAANFGCGHYACRLDAGWAGRCNPANAPQHCNDAWGLEPSQYLIGMSVVPNQKAEDEKVEREAMDKVKKEVQKEKDFEPLKPGLYKWTDNGEFEIVIEPKDEDEDEGEDNDEDEYDDEDED